jgi:hypothetical protein
MSKLGDQVGGELSENERETKKKNQKSEVLQWKHVTVFSLGEKGIKTATEGQGASTTGIEPDRP